MDELRARMERFLGILAPLVGLKYPLERESCGICGADAPVHVCGHCDRACTGIGCDICRAEAARYSRIP